MYTKPFRVAAISDNTNSFGLHQVILVAQKGEAYKACASYINLPKKGDDVFVPLILDKEGNVTGLNFAALGYEIPEKMQDAPKQVVDEIFERKANV